VPHVSGSAHGSGPWPYPRVLAHRGGGSLAPENTLAAFELGLRHGYRAAELDAVLSADAVPVLLHDATLDRTTSGHGPVDRLTAAELGRLDAGSWFDRGFAHARIPTLEQTLDYCAARGMWLNVEIKPLPGQEARTGRIVAEVVARHGGGALAPLLSSFSVAALAAARDAAPQLARGLLVTSVPADWHRKMEALGCVSLHCDHRRLTRARAQAVTARGYGLLCYTVNEPARAATLRAWGVDAICTDRLDLLAPDAPA